MLLLIVMEDDIGQVWKEKWNASQEKDTEKML